MSQAGLIKERIGHLKLWLGILVVTDISLCGWIMSHLGTPQTLLMVSAVITVAALTVGMFFLDRLMVRLIQCLRDL